MFYSSKLRKTEKQLSQTWEERKTEENGRPNIGKTEKQRKMTFPNLGKSKNAAGCISHLSESQKRRKTLVVGRRNIENTEKWSSSADEMQKTPKNTRRRPTKYRKH